MMSGEFSDYDGPTGAYVATRDGIKPLSPEAVVEIANAAMLAGLGYSERAAAYQKLITEDTRSETCIQRRAARSSAGSARVKSRHYVEVGSGRWIRNRSTQ